MGNGNKKERLLTPEEALWAMFDSTDENGIVTIDKWFTAPSDQCLDINFA